MPEIETQTEARFTRKPIAASTVKKYEQAIARLKDLNLQKPEEFFNYVKDKELGESFEKLNLSAIKWYLSKENMDFPDAYQKRIDELYNRQNDRDLDQNLSEKLKDKFVPFDKLAEAQKALAEKDKTDKEFLDYVITSLYTLNPPIRNNYGDMKVFKRRDDRRKGNELIWRIKNPIIVMRDYKNAGSNGAVELPISKSLQKVITEWFNHLKVIPSHILGAKYSDSQTTKLIAGAFGKGKFIGIDNLRHAYIQHHLPDIATDTRARKNLADRMLHSVERQQAYFSKNI
jgi:hypothetical protein